MLGHEVPTLILHWEDLEEDSGPIIHEDIFLGCAPLQSLQSPSVVFVEPEQDINNGGFYSKFNGQNFSTHSNNQLHQPSNKWFDDYVNFTEETFGTSSKSLPVNTGSNFPNHSVNSYSATNDYDANLFYSNSFSNFQQQQSSNDQHMQDLSGPSTSGFSTNQFAQLNLQEPSTGIDPNARPPIPESEYSASYSAPGSAYSSDWSSGSDHSSSQSQDEILDEIHRECAEIERKSVSPPIRQKVYGKRRSNTIVKHSPSEQIASNSSTNSLSLSGLGNSDRKKELNRIAATKYREKKRREKEEMGTEQRKLEIRNHELKSTLKELKTEVNYLKKLMRDMESRASQH